MTNPPFPQQPYRPAHLPATPTAPPKSPGVAALLSLLIPGLGHLYSGNPIAAVFWFLSAAAAVALIAVFIGIILAPCVWVGAMIHAYISTANFNRRHNVVR